jgi:hypothetical protein
MLKLTKVLLGVLFAINAYAGAGHSHFGGQNFLNFSLPSHHGHFHGHTFPMHANPIHNAPNLPHPNGHPNYQGGTQPLPHSSQLTRNTPEWRQAIRAEREAFFDANPGRREAEEKAMADWDAKLKREAAAEKAAAADAVNKPVRDETKGLIDNKSDADGREQGYCCQGCAKEKPMSLKMIQAKQERGQELTPNDKYHLKIENIRQMVLTERCKVYDAEKAVHAEFDAAIPTSPQGTEAKDLGIQTLTFVKTLAKYSNSMGQLENALDIIAAVETMLDVVVGLDPFTGAGRNMYELISGKNLITGAELTDTERAFSLLGVVTGNLGKNIAKGIAVASKAGSLGHVLAKVANRSSQVEKVAAEAGKLAENAEKVMTAAQTARKGPGIASISRQLKNPEKILHGTHGNLAQIPESVAKNLEGKSYNSFDAFRKDFWKEMAKSPHAEEFAKMEASNIERMAAGRAPLAHPQLSMVKDLDKNKYTLHHIENIQHGGEVYDMSNLVIAAPHTHTWLFHMPSNKAVFKNAQ